jgi:hypothetical protein
MMFDLILDVMNGFQAKMRFNRPVGTGLFSSSSQALRAWPGIWTFQRLLRRPCRCVPEGQCDRSLARSAWESVPRKNRPVGYGMTGTANPRGISRHNVRRVS